MTGGKSVGSIWFVCMKTTFCFVLMMRERGFYLQLLLEVDHISENLTLHIKTNGLTDVSGANVGGNQYCSDSH